MTQEPTCGQGLAENSALPAKLAEVIGFLSDVLQLHLGMLDPTDPRSRDEHDAYDNLAAEYRQISTQLRGAADRMAGYRDLPMGRHDMRAATDPRHAEAFEAYVRAKVELYALLQQTTEEDEELLAAMRDTA